MITEAICLDIGKGFYWVEWAETRGTTTRRRRKITMMRGAKKFCRTHGLAFPAKIDPSPKVLPPVQQAKF